MKTKLIVLFVLFYSLNLTLCSSQVLEAVYSTTKLFRPLQHSCAIYDGFDKIYLFGGWDRSSGVSVSEILEYSISTDNIQHVGSLPLPSHAGSVAVNGRSVFYFGGGGFTTNFSSIFSFNLDTLEVTSVGTLGSGHYGSFAITNSPIAYICNVFGEPGKISLFNLSSSEMELGSVALPVELARSTAVGLAGHAYIFGDHGGLPNSALKIDLETWELTNGPQNIFPFLDPPSTLLAGRHAYIIGGYDSAQERTDGIIRFDPETFEWQFFPVNNFLVDGSTITNRILFPPAMVWVEKYDRIYSFGGTTRRSGSTVHHDQIFYIDLNAGE